MLFSMEVKGKEYSSVEAKYDWAMACDVQWRERSIHDTSLLILGLEYICIPEDISFCVVYKWSPFRGEKKTT